MYHYFVYILKCSDDSYYIGVTNDVQKRLFEHNQKLVKGYTFKRTPVKLVYYQQFSNIKNAIAFEKQLKGWRRAKKEALIEGNIQRLKNLSKTFQRHPSSSSG